MATMAKRAMAGPAGLGVANFENAQESTLYLLCLTLTDTASVRQQSSKLLKYHWQVVSDGVEIAEMPFTCRQNDVFNVMLDTSKVSVPNSTPTLKIMFQSRNGLQANPLEPSDANMLAAGVAAKRNTAPPPEWWFTYECSEGQRPFWVASTGPEYLFTIEITIGDDSWLCDPQMNVDPPSDPP